MITELHYITPCENLASILQHGLLSHNLVRKLPHKSVAMSGVQARREGKQVPDGLPLHDYVNLYFCAKNPMLYYLLNAGKQSPSSLCIIRVRPEVIATSGAVVCDQNASTYGGRFYTPDDGMRRIVEDFSKIFADDWRHPDNPIEEKRHKAIKCAELLVPERILPQDILGAYVHNEEARQRLKESHPNLDVQINKNIFFNRG